jgi:succinate-semialdehyde dehydrogenase/glutarate-semialdehyde dehydrogenase
VAAAAGRALKKSLLELGGSDPFLVLADADLPAVAAQAARSRFLNSGQSCLAAKRFVVEEAVADEFEGRFVEAVDALVVGDPMDPATQVGPLARADLADGLDRQVRESVAKGARVLTGGRRLGDHGCFYAPTVLGDVRPGMPAYDEETFPVAAVIRTSDEQQAVRVATTPPTASAPRSGPGTPDGACGWPGRSSPAPSSSTPWSPPTRGCPLAGSSAAATDGSWPPPGSGSSPTCAPGGSAAPPPPPPAPP